MPLDHIAGGNVDVLHAEGPQDSVEGQVARFQGGFIDVHQNLPDIGRINRGRGHAVNPFQSRGDIILDSFLSWKAGMLAVMP